MPTALGDLIIDMVTDHSPDNDKVRIDAHKIGTGEKVFLYRLREERFNFGYNVTNAYYTIVEASQGTTGIVVGSDTYYDLIVPYLTIATSAETAFVGLARDANNHIVEMRQARFVSGTSGPIASSKTRTVLRKIHGE